MDTDTSYWRPDWDTPATVECCITTRRGGSSAGPYGSNNMATHVGDQPAAVARNRSALQAKLGIAHIQWLQQVHGADVCAAQPAAAPPAADGCFTRAAGLACGVLTADCLPILVCDRQGSQVAALHAGWRGLAGGIIAAGLSTFAGSGAGLLAYLGPAIGPSRFEVGGEVLQACLAAARNAAHRCAIEAAFSSGGARPGHYYADLYALARAELRALGVDDIAGGGHCTYSESASFYSYRREARTGRMASLIWLTEVNGSRG